MNIPTNQCARSTRLLSGLALVGLLAGCDLIKTDNDDDDDSPPVLPTVSLAADPAALTLGTATTLTWTSSDASACTASGAWTGERPTAGSASVTPIAVGDAVYTLDCTGPGGAASATATVAVADVPMVSLRYEGMMLSTGNPDVPDADGEIAGATVTVSVLGRSFTGSTDIDGNYAITATVPAAEAATETALIEGAITLDSGLRVLFYSLPGSIAAGLARAGGDGLLSADEDARVNLTPLSTAEVQLVIEALTGPVDFGLGNLASARADRPLASSAKAGSALRAPAATDEEPAPVADAQLVEARLRIDYRQLLDAAIVQSMLIDRGLAPLPPFSDTYSLLYFRDVRQLFVERQQLDNAALFAEVREDTLANRDLVPGIRAEDVPARAITAVTGDVTEEALYGSGGSATRAASLDFDPDGNGRYSTFAIGSDAMRWTVNEAGTIEVRFDVPASRSYVFRRGSPEGGTVDVTCVETLVSVDLQPIGPMAAIERARTTQTCNPATPSVEFDTSVVRPVLFASRSFLPSFAASDFADRTLAFEVPQTSEILNSSSNPAELVGDVLSFAADGTGRVRYSSQDFTWTISTDGELDLAFPSGRRTSLRPVRDAFTGATQALLSSTLEDGRTFTRGSLMYEVNDGFTVETDTAPGTYYFFGIGALENGYFVQLPNGEGRPATRAESAMLKGIGTEFFPSGNTNNGNDMLFEDENGNVTRQVMRLGDGDRGQYWAIAENGDLIVRRFFRFADSAAGCGFEPSDPTCTLDEQREISPIFRHGEKLGWIQRNGTTVDENGRLTGPVSQSLRYYVKAPIGDILLPRDDAGAMAAAAAPRPANRPAERPSQAVTGWQAVQQSP